ncbi:MAG: BatD family protein [Bacteroidales bacterium]|nr:BatD family protein [Bacteroidales bacterium]
MKRLFAAIAGMLWAVAAFADPTITVEVHNIVERSEQFNLVFVVEGENSPSDFRWEAGEDFTVVWGPQKGSSTSIQIINGKTTRSSQTSYTYILQPKRTGEFTIAPATAKIKGKEYQSRPVTVKVIDNGSSQPQQSSSASASSQVQGTATADADIFMRLTMSRSNVVVGEPVTVSLKIYHRANLVGFENARFPSFKGFWSQEVEAPTNLDFQREEYDGTIYNSALLRRWVIVPQKAGDLEIDPAEVVCLVNVRRRRSSGSVFDDFFGSDYSTLRQRVYTTAPVLHVSALPAGAPASFCGGVGEFSVKARLNADSLKTHDAASLVVTVSGKGNVALLEAPKVNFPPDFEVYDIKSSTSAGSSATSGTRTFEYPFIPRSHGDFVIEPVKYSYYDVKARRYVTATTDSLHIHVQKVAGSVSSSEPGASALTVERKGVRNIGEDIRYIHGKTTLEPEKGYLVGSGLWWGIIAALVVLSSAFAFAFRRLAARRADVVGNRGRKATKQALRRLAQARDFLKKDLYTAFYEELHRSLLGFVGDKLGMDMASLSKENISARLIARGVSDADAAEFVALLDECEFARYAPVEGHDAMSAHYQRAVASITAIDSSMKKAPSSAGAALVLAILLASVPQAVSAAQNYPDSLFTAGVEAYSQGNYGEAVSAWEGVLGAGLTSKDLYYNLGNAYYRTGEIAPAILNYERALRIDPSDADVRYNLEFARSLTQDRIDEIPEFFLKVWMRNLSCLLPSNVWAVLSLVLFALALLLGLLYFLGSTSGRRKAGFFGGIAALVVAFAAWGFAAWQRSDAIRQDYAIVMKPVSAVKNAPSGEKDLFILHEGTKVRILDNVGSYTSVSLSDGRQGWISASDIELI